MSVVAEDSLPFVADGSQSKGQLGARVRRLAAVPQAVTFQRFSDNMAQVLMGLFRIEEMDSWCRGEVHPAEIQTIGRDAEPSATLR
jgi:hypothetical protein